MILKKDNLKVIITASHNFSVPTFILINLLKKNNIKISGIIIVSLFESKRINRFINNKSFGYLLTLLNNLFLIKFKSNINSVSTFEKYKKNFCPALPSITNWCKKNKIKFTSVREINSQKAIDFLEMDNKKSIVIYSGGGILKNKFLKSASSVINAHAGPLPEIRGMNAAEWSALLGLRSEITLHFIDSGIDTGKIIKTYSYDRTRCADVDELRKVALIKGIEGIIDFLSNYEINIQNLKNTNPNPIHYQERQYFTMSPLLRQLTNEKLKSQNHEKIFNNKA